MTKPPCRITGVSAYKLEITLDGPAPALLAHYDLIQDSESHGVLFHAKATNSIWSSEVEAALGTLMEKIKDDLMAKHFKVTKDDESKETLNTLFPEQMKKSVLPRSI